MSSLRVNRGSLDGATLRFAVEVNSSANATTRPFDVFSDGFFLFLSTTYASRASFTHLTSLTFGSAELAGVRSAVVLVNRIEQQAAPARRKRDHFAKINE